MPKRTTPFQMIIHSVRKQTAERGVTVTESKELQDARLGVSREVDVVVEGSFDGEPVVTSLEVIEHGRPASITWVEQQIAKHRALPTNLLVLVSKSGFSRNAVKAAAVEGGWVRTMSPQLIEDTGELVIFVDVVRLKPKACKLLVDHPDHGQVEVQAQENYGIYDAGERHLGFVVELAREFVALPGILETFSKSAHNHPERDQLVGFSIGAGLQGLGYHLRDDATFRLHQILELAVDGDFEFEQAELPFTFSDLGGRQYGSGEGLIFGRPGIWTAIPDQATKSTTVSWRMTDNRPVFEPQPPKAPPKFPELAQLHHRKMELTDPGAAQN